MAQRPPSHSTMKSSLQTDKISSKIAPAPRSQGLAIGEARKLPRGEDGPDGLDAYHAQWHHPSRRESSYADAKPRTTQARPKTYHEANANHKHHPEPEPESKSDQKLGLRQKVKVAKNKVKETLQVGKETFGFIRELHKQHKELTDLQRENSLRVRGERRHGRWRSGARRSSVEYDSD